MQINDLPDDCLLTIFDYFEFLDDLIQASKVCRRWANLVPRNLTRVEYLLRHVQKSQYYLDSLEIMDRKVLSLIKVNEFLPNLKIFEASYLTNENLRRILEDNSTIKGIIDLPYGRNRQQFPIDCEHIEMVCVDRLSSRFQQTFRPDKITQLNLQFGLSSHFDRFNLNFNNLSRLHVHQFFHDSEIKQLPTFPKLKVLEIFFSNSGYLLVDGCPSLESAYILIDPYLHYIDDSIRNHNLEDLVIHNTSGYLDALDGQSWLFLWKLVSKYPNLQNLAIRENEAINDENVEELITLLPRLKLMDLRGSRNVTKKSAQYLRNYNKESGRSIVIYYDEVPDRPSSWTENSLSYEKICSSFNFMKHCFYQEFRKLPILLDG